MGLPDASTARCFKKSRYLVEVPRTDDTILFHSTLFRSTAQVSGPAAVFVKENSVFDLLDLPEEGLDQEMRKLIEQELLVPEDWDESARVRYLFDAAKFDYSVMEIMLLTTMMCNFACKYCSEAGIFKDEALTIGTLKQVVDYVQRIFDARRVKFLRVGYYGGEPLLELDALVAAANELSSLCQQYGCTIEHFAITNGFLLDQSAEERLLAAGVRSFQVTLDGPQPVHNARRPTSSGEGSWRVIHANVERLLRNPDLESLSLRINVDSGNQHVVPDLLDELVGDGIGTSDKVTTYIAPVVVAFSPYDSWNEKHVLQGTKKAEVFIRLWREMAKRDLPVEVFPDYFPCGLRVDWASLIDPGGVLYTCAGLLGNPEYAKGTVGSTSVSQKHIELLEDEIPGPCLQCRWVPVCGGGCRYVATVLGVDRLCEKAFYERAYPEYVRIRAEQALATLEGQPPASGCL